MVKLRKVATLAPVVLAASLMLTGCGDDDAAEVEQGVEEGVGEVEQGVEEGTGEVEQEMEEEEADE